MLYSAKTSLFELDQHLLPSLLASKQWHGSRLRKDLILEGNQPTYLAGPSKTTSRLTQLSLNAARLEHGFEVRLVPR